MKISVKAGLALAVSAAFVATSVAPAFAASQVDFSGFYRAKFHTFGNNNWNSSYDKDDKAVYYQDKRSDTWFANRFRLNMDIQATDEISVHARWHGSSDTKWGQEDGAVKVKYAFGQVKQDWGTIQIGYLNDQDGIGHAGLKMLGWDPTSVDGDEENYRPFDTGNGGDGINYFNTWDNGFSFEAAYLKMKSDERAADSNDDVWSYEGNNPTSTETLTDTKGNGNDRDFDRYQVEGRYAWDTGAASLAVMYDRDATGDTRGVKTVNKNGNPPDVTSLDRAYSTTSIWYLNPAFMQSWGAFSTHAEAMFAFGKFNNLAKKAETRTDKYGDDKISGQGYYIDFDYNYGPGRVNLAGWWTSGSKWDDNKYKGLPDGMGQGFNPLLVLYDGGALRHANAQLDAQNPTGYEPWRGNHWAIDLNGQHAFTDEITARWAIAYASLTKASDCYWDTKKADLVDKDKDLGWEIDLGLDAEILDNLHYYTGFGYLFAGDALAAYNNTTGKMESPDDGYAWINTLYFNF